MSKLFTERIPFKPFEYPDYYNEGWLKQMQAFWLHTEIPMQGDVKDWNENLTKEEKHLVGNILLGFAQTECANRMCSIGLLDWYGYQMVSKA